MVASVADSPLDELLVAIDAEGGALHEAHPFAMVSVNAHPAAA